MYEMVTAVIDEHYRRGRPDNSMAYIVGGYVDLTTKDKDYNYCVRDYKKNTRLYMRYEEISFADTINESYIKAIHRYATASNRLKAAGLRPVFATIPPLMPQYLELLQVEPWTHRFSLTPHAVRGHDRGIDSSSS